MGEHIRTAMNKVLEVALLVGGAMHLKNRTWNWILLGNWIASSK